MATTNISDLPPNPRYSQNTTQKIKNNISLETKEITPSQEISQHIQNLSTIKLPARDIPVNTAPLVQDERIQPNYIPPVEQKDYIKEEEAQRSFLEEQRQKKIEKDKSDQFYTELQVPIFAMLLFFIFQMQFVQKLMKKNAPSLFLTDNNLTFGGYLLKTVTFGLCLYGLQKTVNYLTEWNTKINKIFNQNI